MDNIEITDGIDWEVFVFSSFCFVVGINWDLERRIVGALLIERDFSIVRTLVRLSSIAIDISRFITMRVLLRWIGSSFNAQVSNRSSCVLRFPLNSSLQILWRYCSYWLEVKSREEVSIYHGQKSNRAYANFYTYFCLIWITIIQ